MTVRATRARPSRRTLLTLCALLAFALACSTTSVAAQVDDATQCSDTCAKFYEACERRNKKALDDCRAFNKCNSDTKCSDECKHACATCTNYWGYYVNNACELGLVSCLSTCK